MKKIIILVLFLVNVLFAEPLIDEPFADVSSAPKDCPSGLFLESQTKYDYSSNWILEETPNYGTWYLYDETSTSKTYIYWNKVDYYYSNSAHISFRRVTNWCEPCSEESDPAPTLPNPPFGKMWDLKAYKECFSSDIRGDYDAWLLADSSLKTSTSQYIGCCGTNSNYYLLVDANCSDGQEIINNECEENPLICPLDTLDNGIRNENECVQSIQDAGGNGTWLTQDNRYFKCCVSAPSPKFECSEKGENWSFYGADNIEDCQSTVNGTTVIEASWESGDNISPTCCILNSDNNDTENPDNNDTENPDNNDTENPDNNDTETPDNNNSDLDDTNDKLDDLNDNAKDTNDKLDDLNDKAKDTNDKLDTANGTLEDIKNNTSDTNNNLTEIKDILNGTNEDGVDESKELKFDGAMSAVNEFRTMVSDGFNNVRNTFKDAPQLSPSQSQCDFSFTLSSGTNISVDVHSYIIKLRPYLDIIWTFLFALIGFKIYLFVFIKITEFLR